jgi:hypothetical protein
MISERQSKWHLHLLLCINPNTYIELTSYIKLQKNSAFCSFVLFRFMWLPEQTAITFLHSIQLLFSNGYGVCLLRCTSWIFSYKLNKFLCHSSGNWIQTMASERVGPGLISDQWHLWLTKWLWDRFFSEYVCCPLSISFHRGFVYMLLLQQSQTDQVYKPSKKQSLSWIQGSLAIRLLFHSLQRAGKNTKQTVPYILYAKFHLILGKEFTITIYQD